MLTLEETPARAEWLKALFPWEAHSVRVNGRRMAYVDEGPRDGRPVLLLHGNPTSSFLYRDFIEPLVRAGYRAIAPDWIGAGSSEKPRLDAAYSIAHHVADLVALIDRLQLRGFVVVGQDWGGPQGIGAALQRKSQAGALVLMNTWAFTDCLADFHASPLPWTTWHAPLMGQVFLKRFNMLSHCGVFLASARQITPDEIRAYTHCWDEPQSNGVNLTWPRSIPLKEGDRGWADMKYIQNRLPELHHLPVQLIWAPEDPVFTLAYARRLQELLPQAEEPILIDKAKHFLQDDRGPDIAGHIVTFLDRSVGARP